MAKIIETPQKFRVIQVSRLELMEKMPGSIGICDDCNKAKQDGYLICVLNQWYCPACYIDFIKSAIRYPDDIHIEEIRFEKLKTLFQL